VTLVHTSSYHYGPSGRPGRHALPTIIDATVSVAGFAERAPLPPRQRTLSISMDPLQTGGRRALHSYHFAAMARKEQSNTTMVL
jgi:hypothetical protein